MFGGLFGNDKKLLEDERKQRDTLAEQVKLLTFRNNSLTEEIDSIYQFLVKREGYICKLRKIIIEHLNVPEDEVKFAELDEGLQDLFKKADYYDPRKKSHQDLQMDVRSLSNEYEENNDNDAANKENKPENEDIELISEAKSSVETQDQSLNKEGTDSEQENHIQERKHSGDTEFEHKIASPHEAVIKNKKIPLLRMKEERRFLIKIKDIGTASRDLFVFELELKEYTYSTFEAIKQFVSKESFTADEIHDEIDRLAEIVSKTKYFRSVFPRDTRERVTNELENYIFQILYPKLFVVDEDIKGFAMQLKDRINVLRQIVTFEMLDIPIQLRHENFFTFAIKEFQKMNDFRAPLLKLQVFQNCANHLIDMFLELVEKNPNSDELFPLFVYTVLQANIDMLKVNVDYIFDYLRRPLKLGREGFLIINLKAVIKFLSELDGNSLKDGKLEIKETSRLYD